MGKKADSDLLIEKQSLTSQELLLLQGELESRKKSRMVAWLMWLFLGTIGGHRYYLGDRKRGIAFTLFWLLMFALGISLALSARTLTEQLFYAPMAMFMFLSVPAFLALIDAFFINGRVDYRNRQIERELIRKIKAARLTTDQPAL